MNAKKIKKSVMLSLIAAVVIVITSICANSVADAANVQNVYLPIQGTATTISKDRSYSVTVRSADSSWLKVSVASNGLSFSISATPNTRGKDEIRTGYVYLKKGTTTVTTYTIYQSPHQKVNLDCNGGNMGYYMGNLVQSSTRDFIPGNTYGFLPKPAAPSGKMFIGWYTKKTGGYEVKDTDIVPYSPSTPTLYAHYTNAKKVTVYINNVAKEYTVATGSQFTFPSAPTNPDGKEFTGWVLKASSATFTTYKKPGDKITVNSDCTYTETYKEYYRKLGSVKDPKRGVNYSVWMVQDSTTAINKFKSKHYGRDIMIIDGVDGHGAPDYKIVDSYAYTNYSFQRDVCKLIIQYNKDQYRTKYWNRTENMCLTEWKIHNLLYIFFMDHPSFADYEESAKDVDLDAEGHGSIEGMPKALREAFNDAYAGLEAKLKKMQ